MKGITKSSGMYEQNAWHAKKETSSRQHDMLPPMKACQLSASNGFG